MELRYKGIERLEDTVAMQKLIVAIAATVTLFCWRPDAHAATLIGNMMSVEYQFPDVGTAYEFAGLNV